MSTARTHVLTINSGSSSIRFALYQIGQGLERTLYGKLDRIGLTGSKLTFHNPANTPADSSLAVPDDVSAASFLVDWLEEQTGFKGMAAVGHRVVHGMHHTQPEVVTPALLASLREIEPHDLEHLPREIELIEALRKRRPQLLQVVCFDTAFHAGMPSVAKLLPIPRRYAAKGVQRYGFHGLSYAYAMSELDRLRDPAAANGRVILAHLGNGASMAAVRNGKSIDTSMGFTPSSGLPMSTRAGDVDPGLGPFLARTEHLSTAELYAMLNEESGLLGVSEISSDVRDLLAREASDVRAAEALALFCYQAKKWVGAFAAALGGLDTLVFSGGIGENSPQLRARICAGLGFLGVEVNPERNELHEALISPDTGRVKVRIIRTDEELMIARTVQSMLQSSPTGAA